MASGNAIAVFGAGGHGKVVCDALFEEDRRRVAVVVDDDPARDGQQLLGVPIAGGAWNLAELAEKFGFLEVAVAIGDNYVREKKILEICRAGLQPATVIHPAARISRFTRIGQGVVILAGAIVNPGAVIEDFACVNTAAAVDHDNVLSTYCHVYPNATLTGGVRIGRFAYVGSGAVVNPYRTVGDFSYVGAGAVVHEDIPAGVVVAGVPAVEIGKQEKRPAGE